MSDKQADTEDDFYVGYFEKMPASYSKKIRPLILTLFILFPVIAFILVYNQIGFVDSTYEYAKQTELTGSITITPVPAIRILDDNGKIETIPIVTFGKKGGKEILEHWSKTVTLNKDIVSLTGKLIYYDNKRLVEVAEDSDLTFAAKNSISPIIKVFQPKLLGSVTLEGEITDPKCYFGVMKPAYGKPHRSCAIRCISGGIPPVFVSKTGEAIMDYYFIKGADGEDINTEILPWVGDQIILNGIVWQYDDWKEIRISNPQDFQRKYAYESDFDEMMDSRISLCLSVK